MAMLAVQGAMAARKHRKGLLLGCLVFVGGPIVLAALLVLSVLVSDDEAHASGLIGVTCAPAGSSATQVGPYGSEQMGNAGVIVAIGKQRGVPDQGQLVALMAAMTESTLRNLDHGDRDSLGLFQMRPSQGWGTVAQLLNVDYEVTKFYTVLLAVPGWQGLPPSAAAQAVERSGFPDAYNKNEQTAREILGALSGVACQQVSPPAGGNAQVVVSAALSQLGVRYAWGGGTAQGPSLGTGVDAGVIGFDCSGLVLFAYAKVGVAVPHQTQAIWTAFQPAITSAADVRPGDVILLSRNGKPSGIDHAGIYLGNGQVVHAPQSGDVVKVVDNVWANPFWTKEFIGAVRPGVA